MLKIIHLNYPAIFVATLAGIISGIIWYSPIFFRKILLKDLARNERDFSKIFLPIIISIVGIFLLAIILDTFLFFAGFTGMDTFEAATILGIVLAIGIIAVNMLSDYLISGTHMHSFMVHAGYRIVLTLAMAWILALWR